MDGMISGIGGEVYKDVKNMVKTVDKEIDYGKNLEQYYGNLIEEKNKLCARRDDIVNRIKGDKRKRAGNELQLWIDKVHKLEEEVRNLVDKYEKKKSRASKLFHLPWRPDLGKCMEEKCFKIQSCWAEGSSYATDVVFEISQKPVVSKRTALKIEDKSSLFEVFKKILQFLRDKNLKRIGIWGKVGVGKTTIMQNLKENKQIADMFDIVIFVTQTEESGVEKLQSEIAKQLEINLEGIDGTKAIAEELECKRYLLLLDDVSTFVELDDIGIGPNGKNSKVVLASRDRGVCRFMSVDDLIEVQPLTADDALELFEQRLGRKMNSDFKPLAQLIIRECGNLPLLIDKVAINFRKKDSIPLWRAGLSNLRTWPNAEDRSMDDVLDKLRFCYEELGDNNKKLCFLYGALYSEGCDIYTDYLVECWRAEDLIRADKSVRDKGQEVLTDLIDVSLLEKSVKPKHVRMDKITRKMALKISCEKSDSICLVKAGKELRDPPDEKEWEHAK